MLLNIIEYNILANISSGQHYVEGDEVIEVNSDKVQGMTHKEGVTKFKQLKKGPVHLTVRSRVQNRAMR